jgi:hypothetical protein
VQTLWIQAIRAMIRYFIIAGSHVIATDWHPPTRTRQQRNRKQRNMHPSSVCTFTLNYGTRDIVLRYVFGINFATTGGCINIFVRHDRPISRSARLQSNRDCEKTSSPHLPRHIISIPLVNVNGLFCRSSGLRVPRIALILRNLHLIELRFCHQFVTDLLCCRGDERMRGVARLGVIMSYNILYMTSLRC